MPDLSLPAVVTTDSVGYGIGGPIGGPGGTLTGSYFPVGPATTLDLVYIVSRDAVKIDGAIRTFNDGWVEIHAVVLPEPAPGLASVLLTMAARARRQGR
jgi:hypothetical protein